MDKKELQEVKQKILLGEISLRQAAKQLGMDRDKLKKLIESEVQESEEANEFKERLKYNKANSTAIELDDFMKALVKCILRGDITAEEASRQHHIDTETIRRKINEFVETDSSFLKEYIDYQNKKGYDYGNINFKGLIVYLIRHDLSQSEAASTFGIPSRTISREIEKLGKSEVPEEVKLYEIAKICAEKKMKRVPLLELEKTLYARLMDEMFGEIPVIDINMKSKKDLEIERLEEFEKQVQYFQSQGLTAEQVAEKMEVSVSTIRRNHLKLEELKSTKRMKGEIEVG